MIIKEELMRKIDNKDIIVGVVGLGYVGLPLAVEKAKAGYKTIGFDIQGHKVDMVNKGHNYIGDVVDNELEKLVNQKILSATTDFSFIKDVDFIAICVPTPLDAYKQPNINYVKNSCISISGYLKKGSIVVLESTTYPGTTEELILPILESGSGFKCAEDFYLGYSPERVDPGNIYYKIKNTPKVVSGVGKDATEVIAHMYRSILEGDVMEVSSPKVAEMEKILENTYRNINIALVNEMAIICEKMGINIWEVIEAAKTKPYGFQAFYPGPGVGGHCIPLDPYYLTWKAKEYDYHTKLIETSSEINSYMPQYIVERSAKILNKFKKSLNGSKVLILGVAYKQDIDDYRESPALKVIEYFKNSGTSVDYYDPYITEYKFKGYTHRRIDKIDERLIRAYDLIVVITAHTSIDYNMIQQNAIVVFDTKNAMKHMSDRDNIILL